MIIHVVQVGDTIKSISEKYRIPIITLIQENGLTNPNNLVPGQSIIIINPKVSYTAQKGDTLVNIANKYGVSIMELLRNNPHLSNRDLYPGEIVIIQFDTQKVREIEISGFAYPHINRDILKKTLPFLTYLTVFNYQVTGAGNIIEVDDMELIQLAKQYGVAPMMLISTLSPSGIGSRETALNIVSNISLQDTHIDKIISILKKKGYYGINAYLQHLDNDNRVIYEKYISRFAYRMHQEGYLINITVNPKILYERTSVTYEKIDYSNLAKVVDSVLILSYEWGYSYEPPASATPINILEQMLSNITTIIQPSKLLLGIPIIGYDWKLPYIPGETKANAITHEAAIDLAVIQSVTIQYDETAEAPYYFYTSNDKQLHIVWFKDSRSINTLLKLILEFNLEGGSVWNVMYFFTQLWYLVNTQFEIKKLL
ncbi:LysM peptidoglycan-binding domain-containing protein [Anaeromicropila herbilytica]|uniref:Germination protein n=1 Tax=Anaeromicropila herbilytica TaxID=2785025 RepID=A0A7R7EKD7_9FIRM|nr:LysM peptidoglycan-binding domain-containing protein [Anaeromicropila herbilytica]BCN30730.1 germination protein [Anaeromicropila herbilytica]